MADRLEQWLVQLDLARLAAERPRVWFFFAPGIASNADGRLELFVTNGELWRLEQTAWSNGWSAWLPHSTPPGTFVIGPAEACRSGDGRVEVFAVNSAGTLWNIRQTAVNGAWSGWNSFGLAGVVLSDRPALALNADGRMFVFMLGNDGALWHRTQTQVRRSAQWHNPD